MGYIYEGKKQILISGPYPNVQRATGSLLLNDGDHITDSGGDHRISFTDVGATLFKNAGGTPGITLDASNNTTIAGTLTSTGLITANGGLTLGAGDDLIGSATSDININSVFTVAGASGNTVVAGTLSVGGLAGSGTIAATATETVVQGNNVVISATTTTSILETDAGGDAATLADGVVGQIKRILLGIDGNGDMIITPTNFADGATITMEDAGDEITLQFDGTNWRTIANNGCTIG